MSTAMSSNNFMNMDSMKEYVAIDIPDRPDSMYPKPKIVKRTKNETQSATVDSSLVKRKYKDAFDDASFDDARYDQHIAIDFFETNIGHNVIQTPDISTIPRPQDRVQINYNRYVTPVMPTLRRERDCESKYEPEELMTWCEYYLANRNLFNV